MLQSPEPRCQSSSSSTEFVKLLGDGKNTSEFDCVVVSGVNRSKNVAARPDQTSKHVGMGFCVTHLSASGTSEWWKAARASYAALLVPTSTCSTETRSICERQHDPDRHTCLTPWWTRLELDLPPGMCDMALRPTHPLLARQLEDAEDQRQHLQAPRRPDPGQVSEEGLGRLLHALGPRQHQAGEGQAVVLHGQPGQAT